MFGGGAPMPGPGISGSGPDFNFDAGVFATAGSALAAAGEAGGKHEDNAAENAAEQEVADTSNYNRRIELQMDHNNEPHANASYKIVYDDGTEVTGKTDAEGAIFISSEDVEKSGKIHWKADA